MSALYQLRFQGVAGQAHGSLYLGRGVLLGIDVMGGRYNGSYTEDSGRLVGKASVRVAAEMLVTGQAVPAGTVVPIGFNLPASFADGGYHEVTVAGQSVNIAFEKLGDVP